MGRPVLQLVLLKQYFSCVRGDERERKKKLDREIFIIYSN